MEETDAAEDHGHAVFVGGLNNDLVTGGAARFEHVFCAAGGGAVDAVAEGEKGVGAEGNGIQPGEPPALLVREQLFGSPNEDFVPVGFFIWRHVIA